jgi:hypothetical protein
MKNVGFITLETFTRVSESDLLIASQEALNRSDGRDITLPRQVGERRIGLLEVPKLQELIQDPHRTNAQCSAYLAHRRSD